MTSGKIKPFQGFESYRETEGRRLHFELYTPRIIGQGAQRVL